MTKLDIGPKTLENMLQERFGYTQFREGQKEIITSLLHGHDTLVIRATGGGKSLCYQLPSLLFKGITLVVTPLISLMEDQVQEARKLGRKDVVALHSGLSIQERKWITTHLADYRLLYISPEGLQNKWLISALKKRGVSLFVVDEAHCISWWGHDFRLDYLKLAVARESLGSPTCLALTATATKVVKQDITKYLHLTKPTVFQFSVDRQNLAMLVEQVYSEFEKKVRILQFVRQRADAGMIYFSSRAKAEELSAYLMEHGIHQVAFYHGGMSAEERQLIQQQFSADELRIICATNAFGMGINKLNIRYVIHYHFPQHLEGYVQEMGRCSRDGLPGLSYVLYQEGDEQIPYHFIEQELPSQNKLQWLQAYISTKRDRGEICTIEELRTVLDLNEQAVQFILYHMEQLQVVMIKSDTELHFTHVDPHEAIRTLNERMEAQRQKKLKQVADMHEWLRLDARECRRTYLLHYFGEQLQVKPKPCCDLCGLDEYYLLQDIDAHATMKQEIRLNEDWRDKLRELWAIS